MTTTVSSQIYNSRDYTLTQITTKLKEYLELENVDLTKSSFLSFVVDILSTMNSNLMFYQISTYKEFFLTKAQLPESIYNLAAFLGYNPSDATPSEVNILFSIPFGFTDTNTQFTIDEGFQLAAEGDIKFATYFTTTVTVTNNSQVSVIVTEGNRTYNLPVTIETEQFLFILPLRQFKTSIQEFQISEDLQQYQFVAIEVPFDGQISTQVVGVRPPESSSFETYTEVASLFLMDNTTKGYVARRTDDGISLQFGNGLIGYQPEPGSTIRVALELTEGAAGNVISGSVSSGDRLYNTTLAGITQIVQYAVTNTAPAFNGEDEESLERIRQNAITNITALERIISENDFVHSNEIIDDSPIGPNSLPVLKRSDIKINEIALFSTVLFGTDLVLTKDLYETFNTTFVPRETVITQQGVSYITVFDMEIDPLNTSAAYTYILYEITQIPTLVTSYGSTYDLYASQLTVTRDGLSARYELKYVTTETDPELTSCQMEISENGATYNMVNDGSSYIYIFADNRIIPKGDLTYFFTISHTTEGLVGQFSDKFIFRLSLDNFTTSNALTSDSTGYTVYDIPTVRKDYYDSIDKRAFETQVLQQLLTTLTFKDYRMLTDFINFKFANTTGALDNMQFNDVSMLPVTSILSIPPTSAVTGDRYIVLNGTDVWLDHDNDIASASVDGTSITWVFTAPKSDQMVLVNSNGMKYIYSETGWVIPTYDIPLQISIDLFVETTYTGTLGDLTQATRTALVAAFTDRFGINVDIYRSEIIDVIQEVDGVEHCRLIAPQSSIFFDFDIDDFTQIQLLQYAPQYVYFTEADIAIRVF